MCVVVADRAIDFGADSHTLDPFALPAKARREIGYLFAERGRRSGLAVSTRKHGEVCGAVSKRSELANYQVKRGQQDLTARVAHHQRMAQVVDIFGGAGKVNKLRGAGKLFVSSETLTQPILDCLDIVIGGCLERFDFRGVCFGEHQDRLIEGLNGRRRKWLNLADARRGGQRFQPLNFNLNAVSDQRILAAIRRQWRCRGIIAAI